MNHPLPVRLAIVGAGQPNVATSHHLPAARACGKIAIAGLCDLSGSNVAAYADEYHTRAYTDYAAMLADPRIEAVLLCTPDSLHAEQTLAAAKAGKHVLCEKPVVMSHDELDRVTQQVRRGDIVYMAAHKRRFEPRSQQSTAVIRSGVLGKISHVNIAVKGAYFPYPKGSPYYRPESRGPFLHNGPHYIDLLCQLVDSPPLRVYAMGRRFDPSGLMQAETYVSCIVRFADGTIGSIEQNLMLLNPRNYPTRERVQIIGTEQTLEWSTHEHSSMCIHTAQGAALVDPPPVRGTPHDPFVAQLSHFADVVRGRAQPLLGIAETRRVMSICLGALDSLETGDVIDLSPAIDIHTSRPHNLTRSS